MLKCNDGYADNFICINYLPFVFIKLIKKVKDVADFFLLTLFFPH